MKTVNIEEENLQISWTIWETSMKFSGKIWLIIILKAAKVTYLSAFLGLRCDLGKKLLSFISYHCPD